VTALPSPGWSIRDWHAAYDAGTLTPECIVALKRQLPADDPAWISVASDDHIEAQLRLLAQRLKDVHGKREALPLYGIPFAVKDNIDAAGFTTTAACAAFAYQPETDAHVVAKLRQAGAIVLGKTNLDQFATGLVGTRSPYGVVPNAFDARYISGGSSSGSGSVVARGLVPFALGTDTAGSGRVPAALNNIVGLKPTRGALSTRGVVPACRTLDCVSLFTLTVEDAALVRSIVSDFDSEDPYARPTPRDAGSPTPNRHFAIPNELEFNSDALAQKAYEQTLERFSALGWRLTPIDFTPFRDLARMLYEGPWVAERFSVMEATLQRDAPGLDPTVKSIVQAGSAPSAVQAFRAEYRRAQLARTINRLLEPFDALIVPTVPTAFTLDAVQAEPIRTNSLLGTYTNFTNLADLCGLAVPGLFREDGLPAGVTLLAPAWNDSKILHLGANIEALLALPRGATGVAHVPSRNTPSSATATFSVAVVGAHLSGLALNPQLTALGGTLQRETTTAAHYKLYVLPNSTPLKPGMVRAVGGAPLTVEVWTLPPEGFARFVAAVPEPLCIGNVELCDGSAVKGFLCEPYAIQGAEEITNYGGFRQYLAALA
jgi:allophanate hydrolase